VDVDVGAEAEVVISGGAVAAVSSKFISNFSLTDCAQLLRATL